MLVALACPIGFKGHESPNERPIVSVFETAQVALSPFPANRQIPLEPAPCLIRLSTEEASGERY